MTAIPASLPQQPTFSGMPQVMRDKVASYLTAAEANALGTTCKENKKLMLQSKEFVEKAKIEKTFLETTRTLRYEIVDDFEAYQQDLRKHFSERSWKILKIVACVTLGCLIIVTPYLVGGLVIGGVIAGSVSTGVLCITCGGTFGLASGVFIINFTANEVQLNPEPEPHIVRGKIYDLYWKSNYKTKLKLIYGFVDVDYFIRGPVEATQQLFKAHGGLNNYLKTQKELRENQIREWKKEKAAAERLASNQIRADEVD